MLRRCFSPLVVEWQYYGKRGITVCERWLQFPNFLEDMGLRPDKMTIDRLNPSGNYEPTNCRWATVHQQATENRKARLPKADRIPLTKTGFALLSPREQQTAILLHQGFTARDIGEALGITLQTARSYIKSLYLRAGVNSKSAIVIWVERHGKPAEQPMLKP